MRMTIKMNLIATVPLDLEPQPGGGYTVTSPLVPEMVTEGDVVEECLMMAQDCFDLMLEIYEDEDKAFPEGMIAVNIDKPAIPAETKAKRERQRGPHKMWHNPQTGRTVSIPDLGCKELKIGTVRSAVSKLGIDWRDFNDT